MSDFTSQIFISTQYVSKVSILNHKSVCDIACGNETLFTDFMISDTFLKGMSEGCNCYREFSSAIETFFHDFNSVS